MVKRTGSVDMTGHDGIVVTGDYINIATTVMLTGQHTSRGLSQFADKVKLRMDVYWFESTEQAQAFADAVMTYK